MFFLSFIISSVLVIFLPGYLLNNLLNKGKKFDVAESIVYAFGTSWALIFFIASLTFIFRQDITFSLVMLASFICFCILLNLNKIRKDGLSFLSIELPSKELYVIVIPTIIWLFLTFYMLYNLETILLYALENHLTLIIAQKISNLTSLEFDRLLFNRGEPYIYLFSLYSVTLALISKISGLEIIQIYVKIPFIVSIVSVFLVSCFAKLFFPKMRELPWIALLIVCASIWSGWGRNYLNTGFGQFTPFYQYQDIAQSLLLPVCFLFFCRGFLQRDIFLLISLPISVSFFFFHAREFVVAVVLFVSVLIGWFLHKGREDFPKKAIFCLLFLFTVGLLFGNILSNYTSEYLKIFLDAAKNLTDSRLNSYLTSQKFLQLFYPSLENDAMLFVSYDAFYHHIIFLFVLLFLPVLITCRGCFENITLIIPIFYIPFLITSIPLLSLLFIKLTTFDILWGGVVSISIFHLYYLVYSLIYYMFLKVLTSYIDWVRRFFIPIFIMFVLINYIVIVLPKWIYYLLPLFVYLWIILGSILALYVKKIPLKIQILLFNGNDLFLLKKSRYIVVLFLASSLIILSSYNPNVDMLKRLTPEFKKQPTSSALNIQGLFDMYKMNKGNASVVDWDLWYAKSEFRYIPFNLIAYLRKYLPAGGVFAVPISSGDYIALNLLSLTTNYLYASGSFGANEFKFFRDLFFIRKGYDLEGLFRDKASLYDYLMTKNIKPHDEDIHMLYYLGNMFYYYDFIEKEQPIFNKIDDINTIKAHIKRYGIECLLITPKWYEYLKNMFDMEKASFLKIYDKDNFLVYRIMF